MLSGFQMSHLTIIIDEKDFVLGIGMWHSVTVQLVPDILRQYSGIMIKKGPQRRLAALRTKQPVVLHHIPEDTAYPHQCENL